MTPEQIERSFTYHPPKGDQAERYEELRNLAKQLAYTIKGLVPDSAEQTLALRRLEESIMYANKGIAVNE